MRLATKLTGPIALWAVTLAGCGDAPATAGDEREAQSAKPETTNERLARQKRFIRSINRYRLPAPAGDASEVAAAAIRASGDDCSVVSATRLDSDGSIIAECQSGSGYRVFNIEGFEDTVALDCAAGIRILGLDVCDVSSAASPEDKTLDQVFDALKRVSG